jgi:hypothetical protein
MPAIHIIETSFPIFVYAFVTSRPGFCDGLLKRAWVAVNTYIATSRPGFRDGGGAKGFRGVAKRQP